MTVNPQVDIAVDNVWTDITGDVRAGGVTVNRGRPDWRSSLVPSRCSLTLDNTGGVYSQRNPNSVYFGKIGRNTRMRVSDVVASDDFSRTTSNGWGTSSSGLAWTVPAAPSAFSTTPGVGIITPAAVSTIYETYLGDVLLRDTTVAVTIKPGVVATGGSIDGAVIARRSGSGDYYYATVRAFTDSTVDLLIIKRVGGVLTVIEQQDQVFGYDADTQVRVEFILDHSTLKIRAWDVADPSTLAEVIDTDTAHTLPFSVGCRAILQTGNTNPSVAVEFSDFQCLDVRFTGEVAAWPQTWDPSGNDVVAPIEASGLSRRRSRSLRSAMYRAITNNTWPVDHSTGDLLSYWPMEDGGGSTQAASGIGEQPMNMRSVITFASADGPGGSQPLPDINTSTGRLTGAIARHTITVQDTWWAMCVFKGEGTGSIVALEVVASGELPSWRLTITDTATSWVGRDSSGVTQVTASVSTNLLDGEWHLVMVSAHQVNSTTVQAALYIDETDSDAVNDTTWTLGPAQRILTPAPVAPSSITSAQLGHISVWKGSGGLGGNPSGLQTDGAAYRAMLGHTGETAGNRFTRLCAEEGVDAVLVGDADDTLAMGAQRVAPLLDLLADVEGVDRGMVFEPRSLVGYGYRTRASLYNQDPTVELDYDAGEVSPPFEPAEDDQLTVNDVTVSRVGGSSAQATVTEGPLSVNDPPDGVGVYDESLSVNAESDGQLADIAGWRAHVGTWDEARYSSITVNLQRPGFTKGLDVVGVDVGDVVQVANAPAWLPPDQIQQIAMGCAEHMTRFERRITFNGVPAGPWTVPSWGSSTDASDEASSPDHYDTAGSVLAVAVDSDDTSWSVATTSGPLWTEDTDDLPFDLRISGERVTATAVANTTIGFRAAGAADSDNNASVTPGLPAGLAVGDLLLGLAGIRNTSAVVTVPTGYTTLLSQDNFVLFGRIADGTETTPTIAFSGGAAGDDTIAQLAAFTGTFYDIDNLVVAAQPRTGSSGQNITYPELVVPVDDCLILYLGWKHDDWTSVATIASATEIGEPDSTAGTDAGLVWDFVVQTSKADIASDVFTVTGGAGAVSKAGVVAVRSDVQSFTITRSVNGVAKSHTAGSDIRLWTPPVYSL
jgi:hypothetical protein